MRIRNNEVCYWPHLGYGRFGAKVTLDNVPRFALGRWQALSAGPTGANLGTGLSRSLLGDGYKSSRYLGTDLGAAITIAASFRQTFSMSIGCTSATGCRLSG